jgi:tRNA pseudouridine13 synthase
MAAAPLPYALPDFAGVGGRIKVRDEDFFVQEIPLYEPSGEGEHVYCEIQKVGLPTFEAVNRVSRALRVHVRDIGYAGLKDARAVSRQILSIRETTEDAVMGMHVPGLTVQWARRHVNKLRLGHLAGNRFAIKIRDVEPGVVVKLPEPLNVLRRRGLPNYFGEQRFGRRGDNDLLGAALVRGDDRLVLKLLLGSPDPAADDPQTLRAREAYERHDNEAAMQAWPRRSGMERRILARLMKTHKPSAAVRAVDERLRRLWVSALQSKMFNDVLATRVAAGNFDRILPGDLACKHENGACFGVDDAAAEQARADAFEISPSGPLLGYRMTLPPGGEPLEIEQSVFANAGLGAKDFRSRELGRVKGARRPLRVKPADVELAAGVDEHGPHITVAFTLPGGSFATVLLRELMKSDDREEPGDDAADDGDASPTADAIDE